MTSSEHYQNFTSQYAVQIRRSTQTVYSNGLRQPRTCRRKSSDGRTILKDGTTHEQGYRSCCSTSPPAPRSAESYRYHGRGNEFTLAVSWKYHGSAEVDRDIYREDNGVLNLPSKGTLENFPVRNVFFPLQQRRYLNRKGRSIFHLNRTGRSAFPSQKFERHGTGTLVLLFSDVSSRVEKPDIFFRERLVGDATPVSFDTDLF